MFRGCCCCLLVLGNSHTLAADPTIELRLGERRLQGYAAAWSDSRVLLVGRDGHLWDFHPSQARDFSKVKDNFGGLSESDAPRALQRESSNRYVVSGKGS